MMKLEYIFILLSTFLLLACDVVVANEYDGGILPSPMLPAGAGGNAHIIPWNNGKHYQHLGQCDLVMMKDEFFADGLGIAVHIRTKVEGYWSFIKSVAIKIGNDILEIEGSDDAEANYWINFDFQGDLEQFAGFPVTQEVYSANERSYKIDLSSKYPGHTADIIVVLYKEFVRVKFHGAEEVFGHTSGLLGNYKTGKAYARNGVTEIKDHFELGDQWQVLPYEPRLFRDSSFPQYPKRCVKPQDPRVEKRIRGFSEIRISFEQAEIACFKSISDPNSIKDCALDILATQDLDMVGAF